MYIPTTRWTVAFLAVTLLQAIIGLSLESYVFAQFQNELVPEARNRQSANNANWARAIPTYLSLLIFGFVYQLVLVYDALKSQNTIQVIGLCMMNFGILIYTGIQKDQVQAAVATLTEVHFITNRNFWSVIAPYLIALPCVVALFSLFMSFIAWKLYQEFGWKIYKQIGADLRMKRRFFIYQIYIAVLKFDFFLFLGFAVQFLVIVTNTHNYEVWLTAAAIPVIIGLLLLAAWSARRENMPGTIVAILVYFCALAYFLFKLIRMYSKERGDDYKPARKTLTVFAVMTIILIIVTISIAIRCATNYNKGLKQHIGRRSSVDPEYSNKEDYYMNSYGESPGQYGGGPRPTGGSRMEID